MAPGSPGPGYWYEDEYKVVVIQMYVSLCVFILARVFMQIGETVERWNKALRKKTQNLVTRS